MTTVKPQEIELSRLTRNNLVGHQVDLQGPVQRNFIFLDQGMIVKVHTL